MFFMNLLCFTTVDARLSVLFFTVTLKPWMHRFDGRYTLSASCY